MKSDNKYKKRRINSRLNTKEKKKCLAELIVEIKKAKVFEKNKQLNDISNYFMSLTIILNDSLTLSDSDISGPSFWIPKPIYYSRLLHFF